MDEPANEERRPYKLNDPRKPNREEVETHEMHHLPYRSWCEVCVRGRGKSRAHKEGRQDRGVPEVHLDYMFVGPEGAPGETRTCLVMREVDTRVALSMMVPAKGREQYVVDRVVAFLEEVGCLHGDVVAKSDQESSIRALVEAVGQMKGIKGSGRWIVEHSPVGSSQSNGVIERAVQSIEGQLRVIKLALERRYKVELPVQHPLLAWAVEYAGVVLNRCEVGHDGRTAYERLKGKKVRMPGLEFAEGVLWKSDHRSGLWASCRVHGGPECMSGCGRSRGSSGSPTRRAFGRRGP